jgi:hypothetical protein
MSMILLEPANTITHFNRGDQAADHLINRVIGNFDFELADNPTLREGRWAQGSPPSFLAWEFFSISQYADNESEPRDECSDTHR